MSDHLWFFEKDGKQAGPVPAAELRKLAESGQIGSATLIWREGLSDWTPFDQSEIRHPPSAPQESNTASPPEVAESSTSPPPTPPADAMSSLPPSVGPPPQSPVFAARNAQLNPGYSFGIFEILGKGWEVMSRDFWPMVGFFALVNIIYGVASNLIIPIFFLSFPVFGGFMYYALRRVRNEPADIETVFEGFRRRFGSLAMLSFLVVLPTILIFIVIGSVFALVFGLLAESPEAMIGVAMASIIGALITMILIAIVGLVATFAALLCLDCDIGWKPALGLSWLAFKQKPLRLVTAALVLGIVANIGIIALGIGVFITGAWSTAAFSCLYDRIFGQSPNQV